MNEGRLEIINKEENYDIIVEAVVNEVYIETYYKQYIRNYGLSPAELSLNLILLKEMQFVDLEVEKEDNKIKTKLISKQTDEDEKYTDSLAEGNTGIYIKSKNNPNEYLIQIGNLEPGKTIFLKYHFIQNINFDYNFNYIYQLIGYFPFNGIISPKSVKATIKFETFYPITKLEPKINQINPKVNYKFNDDRKIEAEILIRNLNFINTNLISFVFQTKENETPKLFAQYDPLNNETSFLLRNVEKNQNKKISPGYYYFLFNENNNTLNVDYLKEFLKIFLPVLPEESHFQIIGLGKYMKLYNIKPLKLKSTNYHKIINNINIENINNNNLHDMINIDEVLEFIYNYGENNNMPKFIFLLKKSYFQLFRNINNNKYKKYIDKFQFYEFQLDNYYMNICSLQENEINSYNHFYDEESLKVIIKNQLKCINNHYKDVKYEILSNNSNEILYDFKNDNFLIENQIKNYYFMIKGKIKEKIEIYNSFKLNNKDCKNKLSFNDKDIINLNEGNILAKININKIIENDKNYDDKKVKLSKKYQILGRNTSLFCEIENQIHLDEGSIQINNKVGTSLFININNNNYQNADGLFRNNNINLNNQDDLFENPNNNHNIGGLFGNNFNNNQQTEPLPRYYDPTLNTQRNDVFGNPINNATTLFGTNNTNNNRQTNSLFGTNNTTNNQQTNSLFGTNNTNNNQQTKSLFENNNTINNQQTNSLFGTNNTNINQRTTSLFGTNTNNQNDNTIFGYTINNNNQQNASLFGNNDINLNPSSNNQQRGSLFGNL